MLQAMSEHAELLNVGLNAAMVVIWAVYLQLFLSNHLRNIRSTIHIDLGAAQGPRSRCLVTNLSSGAIYIQGIVADLQSNDHTARTVITDRDEVSETDVQDPMARTNRGTLHEGQTVDIGSLEDLVHRAKIRLDETWSPDTLDAVTITVVALTGQGDRLVGASKTFCADTSAEGVAFSAERVLTRQMGQAQTRRNYSSLLRDVTFS
ncbi:MAG: hypothetical protein ACXIUW_15130 [Roseinatronobacter sp.]